MQLQLLSFQSLRRSVALPSALLLGALLCACAAPPAARSVVYDFGPGATQPVMSNRMAPLPPLVLADVEAPAALEGNAVLYRLAYADAQQLRPYAQARWTMPPGQLLRQRLREQLGQRRPVLLPQPTTCAASSTVGMLSTHCRVDLRAAKLKSRPLTTHPTSGGSNSIIVCQDIAITLGLFLSDVVRSSTGPGSRRP